MESNQTRSLFDSHLVKGCDLTELKFVWYLSDTQRRVESDMGGYWQWHNVKFSLPAECLCVEPLAKIRKLHIQHKCVCQQRDCNMLLYQRSTINLAWEKKKAFSVACGANIPISPLVTHIGPPQIFSHQAWPQVTSVILNGPDQPHLRGRIRPGEEPSLGSPDGLTSAPLDQDNYIHL